MARMARLHHHDCLGPQGSTIDNFCSTLCTSTLLGHYGVELSQPPYPFSAQSAHRMDKQLLMTAYPICHCWAPSGDLGDDQQQAHAMQLSTRHVVLQTIRQQAQTRCNKHNWGPLSSGPAGPWLLLVTNKRSEKNTTRQAGTSVKCHTCGKGCTAKSKKLIDSSSIPEVECCALMQLSTNSQDIFTAHAFPQEWRFLWY
jgi:hypothetical protein